MGTRRGNDAGLVTTTGGGAEDLLHTKPLGRKVSIKKVMWYNPGVANVNILIGSYNTAGAFVQVLPTIIAVPTLSGSLLEEELPSVSFVLDTAGAGTTGDIYVQDATVGGGLLIRLEVDEH